MEYDKELIAHKLQRWDKFITDYHLPDWETIPDFGLYMDRPKSGIVSQSGR